MQPDYSEQVKRQQKDYQRSRDPFQYGQQVAKRRYSEIISGVENQQKSVGESYGNLFQQMKQQSLKGQAAGGPTMSGGMGQQQNDFYSTAEMQATGQIAGERNRAMRDLATQAQSAFSNAQLEGQQATQMELGNRQAEMQLVQQKQAIVNDPNLDEAQKREQLEAMGVDTSKLDLKAENTGLIAGWEKLLDGEASFSEAAGTLISSAVLIGGAVLAIKYGPALLKGVKTWGSKLLNAGKTPPPEVVKQSVKPTLEFFVRPVSVGPAAAQAAGQAAARTAGQTVLNAGAQAIPLTAAEAAARAAATAGRSVPLRLPAPRQQIPIDFFNMANRFPRG